MFCAVLTTTEIVTTTYLTTTTEATTTIEPTTIKILPPSTDSATCVTWGQKHYRTFDGTYYSFCSKCSYTLARDCINEVFTILVNSNNNCDEAQPAKCQRSIDIYLAGNEVHISLSKTKEGKFVATIRDKNGERREYSSFFISLINVEEIGEWIYVDSSLGFKLR